jgi:SAM-dependent methyltransferase
LLHDYPIVATKASKGQSSQKMAEMSAVFRRSAVDGVSLPATRWETKKLPQIEWMCLKIQDILRNHPDYGKRKLSILDVGGGKGLLAHYLSCMIENVEIHVVDISAGAVANGMKKAVRSQKRKDIRPLSMVNFQLADASSSKLAEVDADVVVGLHACGHLTDIALAHAVERRASFVIVPCCFNSNSHLTIPKDDPNPRTLVHEWLEIPEPHWSHLKHLAELQGNVAASSLGMHLMCAVRAHSVKKKLYQASTGDGKRNPHVHVEILSFPIEFSTRNMALVGRTFE